MDIDSAEIGQPRGDSVERVAFELTLHLFQDSPLRGGDYDAAFLAKYAECLNTVKGRHGIKPMTTEERETRDRLREMKNLEKLNQHRNRRHR
jgi:hypothetical protein